jgi:hypothetical protein
MNFRGRLERLEAAVFLATTPRTCGGMQLRFEVDDEEPAAIPVCALYPDAPVVVFRDTTIRPEGYLPNRKRALTE